MNKSEYGFGGADAEVKTESTLSVPKDVKNFMPEMIKSATNGLVKGENPVGISPETMAFAAPQNAADAAEKAHYDIRDPKKFNDKATF